MPIRMEFNIQLYLSISFWNDIRKNFLAINQKYYFSIKYNKKCCILFSNYDYYEIIEYSIRLLKLNIVWLLKILHFRLKYKFIYLKAMISGVKVWKI
jgi:hypothetical protein